MSKFIMAKAMAHKGFTNMERKDFDEYDIASVFIAVNHPTLGRCYIGSWVTGIGAFHVHFPADAVRIATAVDVAYYTKGRFKSTFGLEYKAVEKEFATLTDLEQMPVDPDWQKYS